MLGGVDDVAGDPEHLGEHVGRAAGQAAQGGGGAEQPVGGFVDGPVAAERHDDVIALVRRLATELGGVPARLGVHGVDLEAALQRVDDQVTQPVGDSGRVGVDDDQHAPLAGGVGEAEGRVAFAGPRVLLDGALTAGRQLVVLGRGGAHR